MSYIKLNNNPYHLSLGNLFNEIKSISINKTSAIQTEIFCILFNIDTISDTTVNNYCTGYRSIGNDYKQIYLNYQKKYKSNTNIFLDTFNNLINILSGTINNYKDIYSINSNSLLEKLCLSMHSYIKNDNYVSPSFKNNYLSLLNKKNYYECLINILFFTILEKKQPLHNEDIVNNTINEILENTNISVDNLREYLLLKFSEGINLIPSLRNLAEKNNPYALNELGNLEYLGLISGTPNYNLAWSYHKKAATYNHPTSCWMLSHMILTKKIGSLSDEDILTSWEYLQKAKSLNSVSSLNTLGLCYLSGLNPNKEVNLNKAISYFKQAINHNYIYAYNNLGKIYEEKKEDSKALELYLISANMEESWACNKVGEFYRLGLGTNKDLSISYKYYLKGSNSPKNSLYPWCIINLVNYFYYKGSSTLGISKDLDKSISLLEQINYHEQSQILLLNIYYEKYLSSHKKEDLDNTLKYLNLLNNNPLVSVELRNKISTSLSNLSTSIYNPH